MRFAPVMTSPIKLNVGYSLTPFGSESKPEERGTSDEGASGEARADLLGEGTLKLAFSSGRAEATSCLGEFAKGKRHARLP